jgi:ABC-type transport system substrate-binding protein
MHRRLGLAAAAVALLPQLLLAGCGPRVTDEGGGAITIALRDSFATFDPAFALDPEQAPYLRLVYEGLVAFDDSSRVVPACAQAWQVSDEGRTIRFEIRPGLVAADGKPVTADDFKRGFQRLFRPGSLRSPGAPQFAAIEGALSNGRRGGAPLGIDVPDAHTLVLRLAWPDPHLIEKLAQPRYVMPVGEDGEVRPNGPYRLEREAATYVFTRNPSWRARLSPEDPRSARAGVLDTIRVLTGIPARRALLGLESGRIDLLCPVPTEYRERLLRSGAFGHVEAERDPPIGWWLVLNCELAPLARRDARRGVALSVHRPSLPEELGDWIEPRRNFADGDALAPGYDPGQARLAFESARYFTGVRAGVTVPRGGALARGLDALAPAMARGGVQVDPIPVARAQAERAWITRRGTTAALVAWQAASADGMDDLAARLLNRGLESGWAGNWSWYRPGPTLDSLLLRGLREPDPVSRAAVRDRVGELLESDLPFIPLARVSEAVAYRKTLSNVAFHPRDGLVLGAIRRHGGRTTP